MKLRLYQQLPVGKKGKNFKDSGRFGHLKTELGSYYLHLEAMSDLIDVSKSWVSFLKE